MEELAVDDTVVASWETGTGKPRQIRGIVKTVTDKRILIKYETCQTNGRGLNWNVREVWRPREQVKKVEPLPGEKKPGEDLGEFMQAMRDNYLDGNTKVRTSNGPAKKDKPPPPARKKKKSWFATS